MIEEERRLKPEVAVQRHRHRLVADSAHVKDVVSGVDHLYKQTILLKKLEMKYALHQDFWAVYAFGSFCGLVSSST